MERKRLLFSEIYYIDITRFEVVVVVVGVVVVVVVVVVGLTHNKCQRLWTCLNANANANANGIDCESECAYGCEVGGGGSLCITFVCVRTNCLFSSPFPCPVFFFRCFYSNHSRRADEMNSSDDCCDCLAFWS